MCSSSAAAPQAIGQHDIDGELLRLQHSFEETLAELDQYAKRIEAEFDSTLAGVFRAHGEMLRDLFASGEFERELQSFAVDGRSGRSPRLTAVVSEIRGAGESNLSPARRRCAGLGAKYHPAASW